MRVDHVIDRWTADLCEPRTDLSRGPAAPHATIREGAGSVGGGVRLRLNGIIRIAMPIPLRSGLSDPTSMPARLARWRQTPIDGATQRGATITPTPTQPSGRTVPVFRPPPHPARRLAPTTPGAAPS